MKQECANILVVDDNRMNRLKLSKNLEKNGHTVSVAEDGHEALKILGAQSFDLVLLDLVMPGIDGFQVLEAMQNDTGLQAIPVIVISAVKDGESAKRCLDLGAEDYLVKDVEPTELNDRVAASLDRRVISG